MKSVPSKTEHFPLLDAPDMPNVPVPHEGHQTTLAVAWHQSPPAFVDQLRASASREVGWLFISATSQSITARNSLKAVP